MNRRVAKAVGVAGAVTFMLALAGPASGLVSRDVIRAQSESTYAGGNGNGGAFIEPAGFVAELENDDPDAKHNVVSVDDGPDGGPLFASPLVDPDENAEVEGTQYLEAGSYRFICTIHSGMEGNLQPDGFPRQWPPAHTAAGGPGPGSREPGEQDMHPPGPLGFLGRMARSHGGVASSIQPCSSRRRSSSSHAAARVFGPRPSSRRRLCPRARSAVPAMGVPPRHG